MFMTSHYRIIIAHDSPVFQSFLQRLIQMCYPAATVLICTDGLAALQALEQEDADMLLTDYHMPHMDGPTLIRTLRARQVLIPIIGISGAPIHEQELRQVGADAFLCAPFSVPVFQQVVHTLLPPLATYAYGASGRQ
jgi:CheY-like chemotaxis protein